MPSINGQTVIDVTDLVEKTRSAFVDWAVAFIYGEELAIPGLGPIIALPVIGDLDRLVIKLIVDALSKHLVMQAFFFNTALRKAAQAQDFVDAANALESAPKDMSNDEYKKLEFARAGAFRNFVTLTN
jgi:hypothetical protein